MMLYAASYLGFLAAEAGGGGRGGTVCACACGPACCAAASERERVKSCKKKPKLRFDFTCSACHAELHGGYRLLQLLDGVLQLAG